MIYRDIQIAYYTTIHQEVIMVTSIPIAGENWTMNNDHNLSFHW